MAPSSGRVQGIGSTAKPVASLSQITASKDPQLPAPPGSIACPATRHLRFTGGV